MVIMFVDLAGFTALTEAHGDQTAVDVLDEFERCIRSIAHDHALTEVNTIGDAFLLVGEDVERALAAATEMMETIAAREQYPDLRIGMHEGDVVWRGRDIAGRAVNVAARVAAEAAAGQVLVTPRVLELAGKIAHARSVGKRRFRHVHAEIELFDVSPLTDSGQSIDPVCKMSLTPGTAHATLRHGATTYLFCSNECLTTFLSAPDAPAE